MDAAMKMKTIMATARAGRGGKYRARKQAENGFSLIEVLISMTVLTVGLVGLLSVFGVAITATQTSQQDLIAKLLANEAMESIFTARNTSQITWDDLQNSGSSNCTVTGVSPCGIFASGPQPICTVQTTGQYAGIMGTTSQVSGGACLTSVQTIEEPGADGTYGNADDVKLPMTNFQRTVLISPVTDAATGDTVSSLRSINITLSYKAGASGLPKTYVLNSFISEYR